jgi:O-antigen ligase
MTEALIVAGCYLAFWSNASRLGPLARPMIFVFLFAACALAIATGRVKRIAATPLELLFYSIAILSAAVSLVRGEDYCIYYTMYYVVILVFASILTRVVPIPRLLDLGAYVTLLCLATCLALSSKALLSALQISVGANGLERYSALNNHPLLMGYIFGSGAILLVRRVRLTQRLLERCVMIAGTLVCLAILLGASSRSGIIALTVSAAFALVVEMHVFRRLTFTRFLAGLFGLAAIAFICLGPANDYLTRILELDSTYRGFGSGATGRTDLWAKGLASLASDPALVAFGGGLRSSEYSVIGFSTENSYITILLDSGVLFGAALIVFMLYTPLRALALAREAERSGTGQNLLALYATYFLFLLIQCFFLRYFIGIGNSTSLMTLFFMLSLSMYPGFLTTPARGLEPPRKHPNAARRFARAPLESLSE